MRLLLVTSVYPTPRRPTKGTFNRELVAALRSAGDDVRVVAPVPWTDLVRVRATAAPESDVVYPAWFYPPRVGHSTHHTWMGLTVQRAIARITKDWRPDLVLGYWTHPDGTVAVEAARRLGVPAVLLVGGSDVQLLTADPSRRRIIVDTLRSADRVLTVGTVLRDRVIALGLDPERVSSFERGVDASQFFASSPQEARARLGLPLDRVVCLWVGRMVPVKGLEVLMAAWSRVGALPAPPLLLLIGDGEERGRIAAMAQEHASSVRFVGEVRHDALPDWYRAADVMLLPSHSEGIPNVLLEGLACGTPFIASAVGGIPGITSPPNVTVPAGDATALATAIIRRLEVAPMSQRVDGAIPDRGAAVEALRGQLRAEVGIATEDSAMTTA